MSKEFAISKIKEAFLSPQNRKWIRIVESILLFICAFNVAYQIIFWGNNYQVKLQYETFFWSMAICCLIIACCFYMKTSFPKIGRFAILLMALSFSSVIGNSYVSAGIEIAKEQKIS